MKKIVSFIMVMFLTLSLTGCVKYNVNMDINSDKSMELSYIIAVDPTLMGTDTDSGLTDEQLEEYRELGFEVTNYNDGDMRGYKLIRKIENIDDISTSEKSSFDIAKFSNGEEKYLFNIKKGLLKNKYSTKLVADTSDTGVDSDIDTDNELALNSDDGTDIIDDDTSMDDTTTNDEVIINGDDTTTDDTINDDTVNDDISMDDDFNALTDNLTDAMSNMDLSLNVNLPYKAISSNATSTNNDGKSLTWKLNSTDAVDMEFAFELYNWTNIYIIGGSLILVIIILLVIIIMGKNRGHKARGVKTPIGPVNSESNSAVPSMDMGLNSMGMSSVPTGANTTLGGMVSDMNVNSNMSNSIPNDVPNMSMNMGVNNMSSNVGSMDIPSFVTGESNNISNSVPNDMSSISNTMGNDIPNNMTNNTLNSVVNNIPSNMDNGMNGNMVNNIDSTVNSVNTVSDMNANNMGLNGPSSYSNNSGNNSNSGMFSMPSFDFNLGGSNGSSSVNSASNVDTVNSVADTNANMDMNSMNDMNTMNNMSDMNTNGVNTMQGNIPVMDGMNNTVNTGINDMNSGINSMPNGNMGGVYGMGVDNGIPNTTMNMNPNMGMQDMINNMGNNGTNNINNNGGYVN